jgi:uncharacterized membrane protein YtjA (UPF0391 family)
VLRLAILFLVVGLVALLLGYGGIAGTSFALAQIFAVIFLIGFVLFLVLGLVFARRIRRRLG